MPVDVKPMLQSSTLEGKTIFLSASIPTPTRWEGDFDALEITDAVVAAGRSVLTAGGVLVTAAHPTIAPLLLYVASEFPRFEEPRVLIYQSRLFEQVLPEATRRFESLGIGLVVRIEAVAGEQPEPGLWNESLRVMRAAMLRETDPTAAIFIGGMEGIRTEYDDFLEMFPDRPVYPLGRPGGESRVLAESLTSPLARVLTSGDVYPAVFRRVIADVASRST